METTYESKGFQTCISEIKKEIMQGNLELEKVIEKVELEKNERKCK